VFHRELRRNSALLSVISLLLLAIVSYTSSASASTFASTSPKLAAGSDTPALSITVLDVGDGDAILITTSQGHAALIDGGPRKTQVRDVLKKRGITRFRLGPARLDVLRPSVYFASERSDASPVNDSTPVIEVSYGAFSAPLAGNATAATELQLIARGWLSPVTLLKVAHHGSGTSTSRPFLEVVKPQIAVISVGKGYAGLPSDAVLGRLKEYGATVYRTNLHGNVTVITDGHTWKVMTERRPEGYPDA